MLLYLGAVLPLARGEVGGEDGGIEFGGGESGRMFRVREKKEE